MKIEKLCEYLNEIGILQLDSINTFLKIYSQMSKNKYKDESDKSTLALFYYFSLISKTEQNLYDVCKNIIDSYSNNQILQRYKGIKYLNNIFSSKMHSRYNLFFVKIIHYINNKNNFSIPRNNNKEEYTNYNMNNNKKGKIVKKNKNDFNEIKDIIEKLSSNKENKDNEFKISSVYNNYKSEYKPNKSIERNIKLNYNYDNYKNSLHKNNKIKERNEENNHKNIGFKSNINYGYNNKIDKEIEKLYDYYHNNNFDNIQNNRPVKKKSKNKNKNNHSFQKTPNYINNAYNIYQNPNPYPYQYPYNNYRYYPYYPYEENIENYNFYQNEQDHIRKVEDKILQLEIQKYNQISEQCPFYPNLNNNSKYSGIIPKKNIYINRNSSLNNCQTSLNISDTNMLRRKYFYDINNLNLSQNKKEIKIKNINKINVANSMDNNNISKKIKNKNRSYSASKLRTKEAKYNINNIEKEEKEIIKKRKAFDEKQKKYIEEQQKKNKEKEKEEEMKRNKEKEKLKNDRKKLKEKNVNENIFNKLYEEGKKKLNEEKNQEEKSKKKKIIDWDKIRKEYNEKYPDDNSRKKRNKSKGKKNDPPKPEKVIDIHAFLKNKEKKDKDNNDKNKNGYYNKVEDKKKDENEDKKIEGKLEDNISKKQEDYNAINNGNVDNNDRNNNMPTIQDIIVNNGISGSKNNELLLSNNSNLPKKEEEKKDEEPKQSVNLFSSDISLSLNLEERRKQMEENSKLNRGGFRSGAVNNLFSNN